MIKKPNISNQQIRLTELVQGMHYLMLSSDRPEQIGTGFYAVYDPVDDAQYDNIRRGSANLGMDAYVVECTFKADTTVVLCNHRAPEDLRSITLEIDAYGNGHPINRETLQ